MVREVRMEISRGVSKFSPDKAESYFKKRGYVFYERTDDIHKGTSYSESFEENYGNGKRTYYWTRYIIWGKRDKCYTYYVPTEVLTSTEFEKLRPYCQCCVCTKTSCWKGLRNPILWNSTCFSTKNPCPYTIMKTREKYDIK